jgi:hypothetical protein
MPSPSVKYQIAADEANMKYPNALINSIFQMRQTI